MAVTDLENDNFQIVDIGGFVQDHPALKFSWPNKQQRISLHKENDT